MAADPMRRAIRVIAGDTDVPGAPVDTLQLKAEQRQNPRGMITGIGGTPVELALAEPLRLRGGDHLLLEDGGVVEVVAEPEPLAEIRAADLPALARLAWHLGDRHVPVQIFERRLRIRRDPAIETLLISLGARVAPIEAPFDPEGGAYAVHHHGHADRGHSAHHHGDHNHHHGDHHHHEDRERR
jgi:urease accessory protein